MTSQYRHRRTSNPATVFPNPIEPGEITVNTANRQIAVGDAASATLGAPKPLLPIRYFDIAAQYVTNDFVVNGNSLYRANKATGPGAFTAADWVMMVGATDPQYVAKTGDVMTGSLSLPAANPTAGVHATNKTYVDALVASKSSVIVSDVKPVPDPIDSTLWYNTLDGQLYLRYNDGDSTQWVIAAPQPDISQFVNKTGDTMTGPLLLPAAAPTQAVEATNKSYVDGQFVKKTGDTITGNLTINKINPELTLDTPSGSSGQYNGIYGKINHNYRWAIALGNAVNETGGNTGSNFAIYSYDDTGAPLSTPVKIARNTGVVDFAVTPTVAGAAFTTPAAPADVTAYSGLQVNGGMEISQERGQTALAGIGNICDNWGLWWRGTLNASSLAVLNATPFNGGYTNYLQISITTAQTALATNDITMLYHNIEGYRVARLGFGFAGARPVTVGFWTCHFRPGVYTAYLQNGGNNRMYLFPYTHAASNIWQYNTFTIPGDTIGTWLYTNGQGLVLGFTLAAGTDFVNASANTWLTGTFKAVPGQVNSVAATSDVFRITGVTVFPGNVGPSATQAPLIMRPYDQELATCMRYYQRYAGLMAQGNGGGGTAIYCDYGIYPMRAVPTVALSNFINQNAANAQLNVAATNHLRLAALITATGYGYSVADVALDARL